MLVLIVRLSAKSVVVLIEWDGSMAATLDDSTS